MRGTFRKQNWYCLIPCMTKQNSSTNAYLVKKLVWNKQHDCKFSKTTASDVSQFHIDDWNKIN